MKILYVTTMSGTFGFLYPHINMLINEGHKVDLATNITKEIKHQAIRENCKIFNIDFDRSPTKLSNLKSIQKIREIVEQEKYQIVHTHTPIASFITRLACRNMKHVKVIYTAHGFHFYKGAPFINWLVYYPIEKIASRWTHTIVTINQEDFNFASKNFSRSSNIYKVNGVGIDLTKFENTEKKSILLKKYNTENKFTLFYAAELNMNKNQTLLIDAIYKVKERIPNIYLILAGVGEMEQHYRERVSEYDLENNIEFVGFRDDIPQILKITEIVLASSNREGLPVNLLEAMASRLPIVATDNRGHRSLVKDGENGYLINLNDSDELAEKIFKLYNSPELRMKLGNEGYRLVQKFTDHVVDNQLKEIYRNTK